MENMNKKPKTKPGQGKTPQQYKDSTKFAGYSLIIMIILLILMTLLSSCTGTYYLSQYDDHYNESIQADQSSITYYNNQIYWGWQSGYYYYYGKPHYYLSGYDPGWREYIPVRTAIYQSTSLDDIDGAWALSRICAFQQHFLRSLTCGIQICRYRGFLDLCGRFLWVSGQRQCYVFQRIWIC